MGEVIPFDFEAQGVRVVILDFMPWFVATDVCRVLEHANPTVALRRLEDDEKQVIDPKLFLGSSVAGGGAQSMNIVSESGLYALILTSNKPAAKRFRKWVTSEVLPAIRRDGYYGIADADRVRLEAGRARLRSLAPKHQDTAAARTEAMQKLEAMIVGGLAPTAAIAAVSALTGVPVRTLYNHRAKIRMVPEADWPAALSPMWNVGPRGMLADCHPEALRLFNDMRACGVRVSVAYSRVREVAEERGWLPLPCERTLRRFSKSALAKAANGRPA
jgi:prophage antirepressor-like protein